MIPDKQVFFDKFTTLPSRVYGQQVFLYKFCCSCACTETFISVAEILVGRGATAPPPPHLHEK